MVKDETIYKIATLLIKIPDISIIHGLCEKELNIPAKSVKAAIAKARKQLTLAADFHRDEELGAAITSLRELYSGNLKIKDYKTALLTRKELNRLFGLYEQIRSDPETNRTGSDDSETLGQIHEHLKPLDLAPPGTPALELARLAVVEITRLRSQLIP